MDSDYEDIKLLEDKEIIVEINEMVKTLERLRKEIKSGGEFKQNISRIYFMGLYLSWVNTTEAFESVLKKKGVEKDDK